MIAKKERAADLEVHRLVIDKCYRMNLLAEQIDPKNIASDFDNQLANLLLPRIHRILDKGLFDMYQVLYTIDVEEEMIKEKIMDLQNASMIPSIIAFAIIDRLKVRYANYHLLKSPS